MPRRVLVVWKTHLDVGFTDFAAAVVRRTVHEAIPAAIDTAEALRREGAAERFVWTTGAWLIHEALRRGTQAARRRLVHAIERGDVVWHALPFTLHSELCDAALLRAGLDIARALDARFGRRTIAAKMTDVPGHTRALVPHLVRAGVRLLHVGVNLASAVPDVPVAFRWQHHDGRSLMTIVGPGYGGGVVVRDCPDALWIEHTDDNVGPPTPESVRETWAGLRARYPHARIRAATLDAFARAMLRARPALPVVDAEIGDSWIHGAASDPRRLAGLRALMRLHAAWSDGAAGAPLPARRARFAERLLLVAEHTWGLDAKSTLRSLDVRTNRALARMRQRPDARRLEASWREQRALLREAIGALGGASRVRGGEVGRLARRCGASSPARAARAALARTRPRPAVLRSLSPLASGAVLRTPRLLLRFDPRSGALTRLAPLAHGRSLATSAHALGTLRYETFDAADVWRFLQAYDPRLHDPSVRAWAIPDFGKPGLRRVRAPRRRVVARLIDLRGREERGATQIVARLAFPDACVREAGAPRRLWVEWRVSHHEDRVDLRVVWAEKRATQLPEATWLGFAPALSSDAPIGLDKIGERIDARRRVARGGGLLHGVDRGLRVGGDESGASLDIETLDAALVAPFGPRLLRVDDGKPGLRAAPHLLLHDNVWNTNFPLWSDDDAAFRMRLRPRFA